MYEKKKKDYLRINVQICGKPAEEAKELKQSGAVRNNADLVCQGIGVLYQKALDERLKTLRLKAFEQTEET